MGGDEENVESEGEAEEDPIVEPEQALCLHLFKTEVWTVRQSNQDIKNMECSLVSSSLFRRKK